MTATVAAVLMAFAFALGWRAARRAHVAAMTSPKAFEAACLAAARVYCLDRWNYEGPFASGTPGREKRIDNDAREIADRPWLRAAVKDALEAAEEAR